MNDQIPMTRLDDIPVTRLDSVPVSILDDIIDGMDPNSTVKRVFLLDQEHRNA